MFVVIICLEVIQVAESTIDTTSTFTGLTPSGLLNTGTTLTTINSGVFLLNPRDTELLHYGILLLCYTS